jgi:hypothetical protein
VFPYFKASWLSKLFLTPGLPLIATGFSRSLEASDLYKLPPEWNPEPLANFLLGNLDKNVSEAKEFNKKLVNGEYKPSFFQKLFWKLRYTLTGCGSPTGHRKGSLINILFKISGWDIIWEIIFAFGGMILAQIVPLVVKFFIQYGTDSYNSYHGLGNEPPLGQGIGLGIFITLWMLVTRWCKSLLCSKHR